MRSSRSCLPTSRPSRSTHTDEARQKKIEDYKSGYPRFTALLSAYEPFVICRRFNKMRARLLLLKQDRLSALEQKLEQIDSEETSLLFLGKSRCDNNIERRTLLSEIDSCLADYDQFTERTHRMLELKQAQRRDVRSLQNWLEGTACLAREETAYLAHDKELVTLAPTGDSALTQLEAWAGDKLVQFFRDDRESLFNDFSTDPNVYIYDSPMIRQTAKAILLSLVTLLLVMPVVICNVTSKIWTRMIIVTVSTVIYLLILSSLTRSRSIELILAGATYATVLIVFVSGTSGLKS